MNKSFWKKVLIIGIPVAIQNLINTLVNMIDTFMLGSIGEDTVSAVGLANKVFFVMNLLIFGIVSGSSVLMSQFYGKGDHKSLNKTYGFSLVLALMGSMIFFVFAVSMPRELMSLFTHNKDLIKIGTPYLRIVSISYVFTAFSMASAGLLRSINRTRAPMTFTLISVVMNVIFNYVFIFGKFGAPRLLADGAAIATLIARITEFGCMIIFIGAIKSKINLNIREVISVNASIFKRNIKIALPVIINEFGWGLGTTMYSVIYGHMSKEVVAGMTIASSLQDLVYAFLFGLSTACAVLVGNMLGASDLDGAQRCARKLIFASVGAAIFLAGVLVLLIKPYIMIYDVSDKVESHIIASCVIFAIFMPVKVFNLINIVGILRSGGDTIICMIIELSCLWGIGVPMGAIGAFLLDLELKYVFLMIMTEEVIKCIIGIIRYKQKKWVKNITVAYE